MLAHDASPMHGNILVFIILHSSMKSMQICEIFQNEPISAIA